MRYVDNNRGAHPEITGDKSLGSVFQFDIPNHAGSICALKESNTGNDILPYEYYDNFNEEWVSYGNPPSINALVGTGRRVGKDFGYLSYLLTPSQRTMITSGNYIIGGWFRIRTFENTVNEEQNNLLSISRGGNSFSARISLNLRYGSNGNLSVQSMTAAGAPTTYYPLGVNLDKWKWYYIVVRSTNITTNAKMECFINGMKVGETTSTPLTSGFDGIRYNIGFFPSSSGAVSRYGDIDVCSAFLLSEKSNESIKRDAARGFRIDKPQKCFVDVKIKDQLGNFKSMNNLHKEDWIRNVTIEDSSESVTTMATVDLTREIEDKSIAPLAEGSFLNRGSNYTVHDPLMKINGEIKILTANIPHKANIDNSLDWMNKFEGNIYEIDWGGENSIILSCRDKSGALVDAWYPHYGNTEDAPNVYGSGGRDQNGAVIVSAPVWAEDVMQQILFDCDNAVNGAKNLPAITHSYAPVTLQTPVNSNFGIIQYFQKRESVFTAIQTIALQIGWKVKYMFSEEHNEWRLRFYEPERDLPACDYVVFPHVVRSITQASLSKEAIRNDVLVTYRSYSNSGSIGSGIVPSGWTSTFERDSADNHGNDGIGWVRIEDPVSIAKYGRMNMELDERAGYMIGDLNSAAKLAVAAVKDLSEPDFNYQIELDYAVPYIEENNYILVSENGVIAEKDQKLAIVNVTHIYSPNSSSTQISMRGKPTIGRKSWMPLDARNGNVLPPMVSPRDVNPHASRRIFPEIIESIRRQSRGLIPDARPGMPNGTFDAIRGERTPPVNWRVGSSTTFGPSGAIRLDRTTPVRTGSAGIMFMGSANNSVWDSANNGISTELIPISSNVRPLNMRITWKPMGFLNDENALTSRITFYNQNRVALAPPSSTYRWKIKSREDNSAWTNSEIQLPNPPSDARFYSLSVGNNSAETTMDYNVFLDSIEVVETDYFTHITAGDKIHSNYLSNAIFGVTPCHFDRAFTTQNATLTETLQLGNISTVRNSGFTNSLTFDNSAMPTSGNTETPGYRYNVPEDGVYEVDLYYYVYFISSIANYNDRTIEAEKVKNSSYITCLSKATYIADSVNINSNLRYTWKLDVNFSFEERSRIRSTKLSRAADSAPPPASHLANIFGFNPTIATKDFSVFRIDYQDKIELELQQFDRLTFALTQFNHIAGNADNAILHPKVVQTVGAVNYNKGSLISKLSNSGFYHGSATIYNLEAQTPYLKIRKIR
jgi:hypothetical protein